MSKVDCAPAEPREVKASHRVDVVPVVLETHPDADTLSIVRVGGYSCVVKTEDWAGVEKAGYLQPDSMVDVSRPEFAFLAPRANAEGWATIRAMRLRGVASFGCLFPVADGFEVGDEVSDFYGVRHYEPPVSLSQGGGAGGGKGKGPAPVVEDEDGPPVHAPKYDLDPLRRKPHVIPAGTPVLVHEKLDGANARYLWDGERFWCGSRTNWKREFPERPSPEAIRANMLAAGKPAEVIEEVLAKIAAKPPGRLRHTG